MEKINLAYSRISDYDRNGARTLIKRTEKDTKSLTIGSLINDLLFQQVDFNEKYFLKEHPNPTSTSLKLANIISENYVKIPDNDEIIDIIQRNGLWSNTKRVEKLIEYYNQPSFWEYLSLKMENSKKIIADPETKMLADEIVYILKTHKHSRDFFSGRKRVIPEYSFNFEYTKHFNLRGIVDMIVIDDEEKTFRIVDLKTGAKSYRTFNSSILEWRYYLQEAVYMLAADTIKESLGISEYKTLPFQFLYIGLSEKLPVIFEVTDDWHNAALRGFYTGSGYSYKGLFKLLAEIKFHYDVKNFETPYELIINDGVLPLYSDTIHVQ